jgi:hypothetical protein
MKNMDVAGVKASLAVLQSHFPERCRPQLFTPTFYLQECYRDSTRRILSSRALITETYGIYLALFGMRNRTLVAFGQSFIGPSFQFCLKPCSTPTATSFHQQHCTVVTDLTVMLSCCDRGDCNAAFGLAVMPQQDDCNAVTNPTVLLRQTRQCDAEANRLRCHDKPDCNANTKLHPPPPGWVHASSSTPQSSSALSGSCCCHLLTRRPGGASGLCQRWP